MEEINNKEVELWLKLNKTGDFNGAKNLYFESIFPNVLFNFESKFSREVDRVDVLFSILGFTPEPILLTQRALRPKKHVIFYTQKEENTEHDIEEYLRKFSVVDYNLVEFESETFDNIYETLKEQMMLYPAQAYALDITGGKKSMVASAAIFGRDYNFRILYVDFDKYDPELRRPIPGYEKLNLVYSPDRDLPELYHQEINPRMIKEVDDNFNIEGYLKGKRYVKIKDLNFWGFYGFDQGKEIIKHGDTYYKIEP